MSDDVLHKFESTIQGMHQFNIYRGNPGCPEILVSCPDERAANAGRRLLSGLCAEELKWKPRRAAMCGCGCVHGPGERCGPF